MPERDTAPASVPEDASIPLARFSQYLSGRTQALVSLSASLSRELDACFSSDAAKKNDTRNRVSTLLWLWVLGAYEVVRTMCQARPCFSPPAFKELTALKGQLEKVRVADAKMEKINYTRREKALPISSDRRGDEWDEAACDVLIGDPSSPTSGRFLLERFPSVVNSISAEEILMSHEASFQKFPTRDLPERDARE